MFIVKAAPTYISIPIFLFYDWPFVSFRLLVVVMQPELVFFVSC